MAEETVDSDALSRSPDCGGRLQRAQVSGHQRTSCVRVDFPNRPKRSAGGDVVGCGGKIRRQEGAASIASVEDSASSQIGLVSVPIESNSAFDWSSLIGPIDSEEFVTQQERDQLDLSGGKRAKDVWVVNISWQLIAKQSTKKLNLNVYHAGYINESGIPGNIKGWFEVDVPIPGEQTLRIQRKFVGDKSTSAWLAMESAAKGFVSFLRKNGTVVVKDASYEELKEMEKRVKEAEDVLTLYSDLLTERNKHDSQMYDQSQNIVCSAKELCKEFKDVLTVSAVDVERSSTIAGSISAMYTGARPPVRRMEKLSYALASLVNEWSAPRFIARHDA